MGRHRDPAHCRMLHGACRLRPPQAPVLGLVDQLVVHHLDRVHLRRSVAGRWRTRRGRRVDDSQWSLLCQAEVIVCSIEPIGHPSISPMNPKEYKRRTHEPDAFARHALEDTLRALSERVTPQSALVELIRGILAGPVIDKPERHRDRIGEDSERLFLAHPTVGDAGIADAIAALVAFAAKSRRRRSRRLNPSAHVALEAAVRPAQRQPHTATRVPWPSFPLHPSQARRPSPCRPPPPPLE
ncbi:hypothetical protein BH11MYX4_BH11MYX4_49200 [soil metagenome]